jgi:hypothetical protein
MSLIAHYKLDGNALDSSGNGNHGSETSIAYTAGKIGQGASSGYITIPNNEKLQTIGYTSISFWININSFAVRSTIIDKAYGGEFTINAETSGYLNFYAGLGGGNTSPYSSLASSTFSTGGWHHFVLVRNSTVVTWYKDGVKDTSSTSANFFGSKSSNSMRLRTGYTAQINGNLDDVRIYDHALSEKEIKELAKAKVLHYTFDDFQEPTENWFYKQNPRIDSSYASYVATTSGTWQANHPNAIRVYNDEGSEITGYINSGVTDWTNTYHAVWEYDYQLRIPVVVQNDVDGNWKAKSWGLGQTMSSMGLSAGMKYTISWLQWTNNTSKRLRVGLYGQNSSGSNGFHDGQLYPSNTMPYTWERVSATFTVSSAWNFSAGLNCYMYGHYDVRAIIKIADVQMEIKDHDTKFSKSPSRGGSVSDNSGYDNHADLALATTPTWIEDSRIGKGAYKFDGSISNYISVPVVSMSNLQDFTVSFWVASTNLSKSINTIFHSTVSGGNDFSVEMYSNRFTIPFLGTISNFYTANSADVWYHISVVREEGSLTLYKEGIPVSTSVVPTSMLDITGAIIIGQEQDSVGGTFSAAQALEGLLDDVRIYATALSADDVKELYNTRAQIDDKGNFYANNIEESTNLLDPYIFMSYSNNSKDPDIRFVDGRLTWRVYPAWFHPNGSMNGMFKANTQYRMRLTISHATIYDSVYRPGGLIIKHTDDTTISVVTTGDVNKTWQTVEAVSTAGKTIEGIYVYYYTSYEVRIDMNNSFLVEEQNYGVGTDGIWKETIFSEIGPANGLVAYYPLNGDAKDYANANDGTVNGAIISAGINGKACYSFDGVDDYIQINNPITGIWDSSFTFSTWAKATSGSGRGLLLGDFSTANALNVNIEWNSSSLRLYWAGSPDINASLSLAYDTWTFLTIVRDKSSSQVRFYKNGVLGYTYSGDLVDKTATTNLHRIGSDGRTGEPVFNGSIQNVRIYNRALSQEEITILYDLERGDTIKAKMDKNTLYIGGQIHEE